MKKTEKIEIRLSHDDKERLSKIADNEGRTISQIVRGLIDRYLDLNSAMITRKTSKKALIATGISSGIIGLLFGSVLAIKGPIASKLRADQTSQPVYSKAVTIRYPGSYTVTFSIPLKDGYSTRQDVEMGDVGNAQHDISVRAKDGEIYSVNITACIKKPSAAECQKSMDTNLDVSWFRESEKFIQDKFGNNITIGM